MGGLGKGWLQVGNRGIDMTLKRFYTMVGLKRHLNLKRHRLRGLKRHSNLKRHLAFQALHFEIRISAKLRVSYRRPTWQGHQHLSQHYLHDHSSKAFQYYFGV